MNFVLCGMMGSGKSRLGQKLAFMTDRVWLDTDKEIEKRYGKISEIFKTRGEEYFRAIESALADELSNKDGLVISTGGGFVLREENVTALKNNGRILFLRATKQTLLERLSKDEPRPLLQGEKTLEKKIESLLKERTLVYERAADVVLDVDGYSVEDNAKRALAVLQKIKTEGVCTR